MMKANKSRSVDFILHALAWGLVLFFPYLISDGANQYKVGPLPGFYFTLSGIVHMVIFYGNAYFLYPRLLNRAYWWLYMISAVLLIVLSIMVKSYILLQWFPSASQDVRSHVLFPSVLVFLVSVFYSIALDKILDEKLQKENEAMQLGMELKFLRSQISPHFLFNTLTNLVSLARKKSDNLETSLLMLAGLMRYMLYDAGKKIALQQEVEYLENYIALQKLRFGGDVEIAINMNLLPEDANHSIEPMLLIAFVENAFKHGADYPDRPSIDIHLSVREKVLTFQVKNKFNEEIGTTKDESSGIGLNNVRSRLNLLYPKRYDLTIHSGQNLFSTHLTLNLL